MNVLSGLLIIAFGTAALAALIVLADWDIAAIRAWQSLFAPRQVREADTSWHSTTSWFVPAESARAEPAPVGLTTARPTAADEWLAAAGAHRLADYQSNVRTAAPAPARSLRDVLAAERDRLAA